MKAVQCSSAATIRILYLFSCEETQLTSSAQTSHTDIIWYLKKLHRNVRVEMQFAAQPVLQLTSLHS